MATIRIIGKRENEMKKRILVFGLLCVALVFGASGCKKKSVTVSDDKAPVTEDADGEEVKPEEALEVTEAVAEPEEEVMSDEELYNEFLKGRARVYFNNYQPDKYFEIGKTMFDKNDSVTLCELLSIYEQYYMEEMTYSEVTRNLGYTYIDAGDTGEKQLVVECIFPEGGNVQFVIDAEDGQLEMMYTIDSYYREYASVANEYGLITKTCSYAYFQYSVDNDYLDGDGKIHDIYIESANYLFGEETNLADPLLEWAAEFKQSEGFKDDVILRTYSFDIYESDFTPEEEEEYYDDMMYTVEYLNGDSPYHEDSMYEEDSVFSRIFEKAGRKLSTPEEIEAAIKKKMTELNMPEKAMSPDTIVMTDFTDKEIGAIFGADVDDGRTKLEHALTAYEKFLKNPVNMCDILTEQTNSPYGNPQPGLIYGFALRDFTKDGIPELVIDFGQPTYPLFQKIYIYQYNKDYGMAGLMFKMPNGANGDFGTGYMQNNADASTLSWYKKDYDTKVSQCPEYADSLLHVKYEGPMMVGTYGRYLVTFDSGVEEDMSKTLMWYDFVEDNAQYYIENMSYGDADCLTYEYSVEESCTDDPSEILENFKPILFYDINDENIEKIVSKEYWDANKGEDGFSDYTNEEAYEYLADKAQWYFDLGIMDDDDSYDTISTYDYDAENNVSTTIYFDLDKLIQSHFRSEVY